MLESEARMTDAYGNTALMCAAKCGNLQAVELLSKIEINFNNKRGITALMLTCDSLHLDCASILVEEAAKVDSNGKTAFMHLLKKNISCENQQSLETKGIIK